MRKAIQKLAHLRSDDRGGVSSAELVMIATLLVIGMIVGLVTFRDSAIQEVADTATAINNLNQSYQWNSITIEKSYETVGGPPINTSATLPSVLYEDNLDYLETGIDPVNASSGCINFDTGPSDEGEPFDGNDGDGNDGDGNDGDGNDGDGNDGDGNDGDGNDGDGNDGDGNDGDGNDGDGNNGNGNNGNNGNGNNGNNGNGNGN